MNAKPSGYPCRWMQDPDATWFTACGEAHVFNDGTPRENGYQFCPYCGKRIEQAEEIIGQVEVIK